jgi:UDP-glucuronate decarboxylase
VGNPNEITIMALAEIILNLTKSQSKLVFEALPGDDPRQRKPDISLAQESLDWSPTVDLSDGLRETVAYFKAQLAE